MTPDIEPISSALRKTVASLAKAKYRRELGLFVAEGEKCVGDTLAAFDCAMLIASPAWLEAHPKLPTRPERLLKATRADLERMSQMNNAPDVIAVYHIPHYRFDADNLKDKLVVALDCVQDPGNLGTIVRIADWMGVTDIIASEGTADVYNPKVIQATMGSIARVRVHYINNMPATLSALAKEDMPVYGTFLDGDDIYSTPLSESGVIVMGNEGHGVSAETAACIDRRLFIPSFPPERPTAESLNVAVATAITLAEFRRRQSTSK